MNEALRILDRNTNVTFKEICAIAEKYFGQPRIKGSHHVFSTPWKPGPGIPYLNFQWDGKMAKPAQVRELKKALKKLQEINPAIAV